MSSSPIHYFIIFVVLGDIIGLYPNKSEGIEPLSTGVVTNARRDTISVAFNEDFDTNTCHMYKMMILTNDITYRRLKRFVNIFYGLQA